MRKTWIALATVVLLMFSLPAFAGQSNQITLSGSSGSPITFTGTDINHDFKVIFNVKDLSAFGDGTFATAFANLGVTQGYYSILNSGATVTNMGPGVCGGGGCTFMLQQSAPVNFFIGSAPGMNDMLQGSLQLVSITQTGILGGFNDQLVINLTVTGGSLASMFPNNGNADGTVQITIKFRSGQDLSAIAKNQNFLASIVTGAVTPVPEPASLTLLGAGLLGFAAFCKKKLPIRS